MWKILELLLASSEDADSMDDDGRTPLSYAAEQRPAVTVRLFVASRRSDVKSMDRYGRTPLYLAATNSREVRQILGGWGP